MFWSKVQFTGRANKQMLFLEEFQFDKCIFIFNI